MIKNALLVYSSLDGCFNIGDYIQSIAASQYFPQWPSIFVYRDEMNKYNGEEIKVIMNGWYSHYPENWPPSSQIKPLFVALHINDTVKNFFLSKESINYFKQHEPIGCRDYNTLQMLKQKGINAYFSACLTLTLNLSYSHKNVANAKIYMVDPIFEFSAHPKSLLRYLLILCKNYKVVSNIARKMQNTVQIPHNGLKAKLMSSALYQQYRDFIADEVFFSTEFICHEFYDKDYKNHDEKFEKAKELLKKYESARYVITSRIHCALPCLAMNTPVIFVNKQDDTVFSSCRFGGLADLFNKITFCKGKVISNFLKEKLTLNSKLKNKTTYLPYQKMLIERCSSFVKE